MRLLFNQAILFVSLFFLCGAQVVAFVAAHQSPALDHNVSPSALRELNDKRRALLIVFRAGVVDTRDYNRALLDLAQKADPKPGRYRLAYDVIAKKLNGYIEKYKSLTPALELGDADFVILFNLIEYRHVLNTTYAYGELFVVRKGKAESQQPPAIIWKSRKVQWAGDAINDLIRELRMSRGEF